MRKKTVIAITAGDPSGIGPEIVEKALTRQKKWRASFLVVGPQKSDSKKFKAGEISAESGKAAIEYIDKAVDLIKTGAADALVTAPISKEAASLAGFKFPGHTEYLAHLTGAKKFCMMLVAGPAPVASLRCRAGGGLRVVLATRHIALKDVAKKLTASDIYDAIIITHNALKKNFRIKNPKIAVCALNPHAGENGLFSDEEKKIIIPAIKRAKANVGANGHLPLQIIGPLPADSLFYNAYRGKYDAEIAMYHDQGLIPLKMVARNSAVNITLGLPFVRTSPAHGTAFDIAGKGIADPSSMIAAIEMAIKMTRG